MTQQSNRESSNIHILCCYYRLVFLNNVYFSCNITADLPIAFEANIIKFINVILYPSAEMGRLTDGGITMNTGLLSGKNHEK
jgi:hypothetical protein